jgi:hypothetical protein
VNVSASICGYASKRGIDEEFNCNYEKSKSTNKRYLILIGITEIFKLYPKLNYSLIKTLKLKL